MEFCDAGVSGTKEMDAREGLSDLIARVRANGIRIMLAERADRLARDFIVSEVIRAEFRRLGVRVIAADSRTVTAEDADPTRVVRAPVSGS